MSLEYKERFTTYRTHPWFYSEGGSKALVERGASETLKTGSQVTGSEGHPIDRNTGNRIGGGPFYTSRVEQEFPTRSVNMASKDGVYLFRANLGTPISSPSLPGNYMKTPVQYKGKDLSSLNTYGATAIAQCAPTNPNSELGTALVEAQREGLPSLPGVHTWKRRTEIARAAGSEFLNAEFGWLPLVSEVLNVGNTVRSSRDILKQYRRDSGRNVRRDFEFPVEETTETRQGITEYPSTVPTGGNKYNSMVLGKFLSPLEITQTIKVSSRKWFKGAFTYCVPDRSDSWSSVARTGDEADKLFGISLTPDVLWELTPWSWAVDWFTNTGDVIHNVNNFVSQGLVMRYGYMMEETSKVLTASGKVLQSAEYSSPLPPDSRITMISKSRTQANPFGFGATLSGLSPTQVAIAAALGLTLL